MIRWASIAMLALCASPTALAAPEDYAHKSFTVEKGLNVSICDAPIVSGARPKCRAPKAGAVIAIERAVYGTVGDRVSLTGYYVRDQTGDGYISPTSELIPENRPKPKPKDLCVTKGGVSIGMTANEIYASCWGKPRRVNETVTARGRHEQWVYGGGYLYLDNGVLTSIQTSH